VAEQVVEHLLASSRLPQGFTAMAAGGHGADFSGASVRERVRGRVAMTLVAAVLPAAAVAPLLEELRSRFAGVRIRYWTAPILDSGDFA
jgi:hypothetical protein